MVTIITIRLLLIDAAFNDNHRLCDSFCLGAFEQKESCFYPLPAACGFFILCRFNTSPLGAVPCSYALVLNTPPLCGGEIYYVQKSAPIKNNY